MSKLRFFYNGIKGTDGKLQKVFYSNGASADCPAYTITIYSREYIRFSEEVRAEFTVENESDIMTDYFEEDHIRVTPNHPLYEKVVEALEKQEIRNFNRRVA